VLVAREVTKVFAGVTALREVTVVLRPQEILGIIGPNGAGKTTLFNVITGIFPATRGAIELFGQPITGLSTHQIARLGVARTFQNIRLFREMTVLENVLVGRHSQSQTGFLGAVLRWPSARQEEARLAEEARGYLDMVGLADKWEAAAGGLPTGQQRLLEIARALASEPRVVLLDEPAAGLNTRETESLAEFIQLLPQKVGAAVGLIEHDMRLVMDASHRVVVIDRGRKIAEGPPTAVQQDAQVIAAYLGEDFAESGRRPAAPEGGSGE